MGISFIMIIFYFLYLEYEFLFERLLFTLETGGSGQIRVIEPFSKFFENFSFLGVNTDFIRGGADGFFVNSFLYIYFSFGLIGLILFLPLIISRQIKYMFISFSLLFTIIIEGLTGRIDFWIISLIFLLMRIERIKV